MLGAIVAAAAAGGVALSRLAGSAAPQATGCTFAPAGSPEAYVLDLAQAQNAAVIAAVAGRDGLADHAVTVALATALRESGLRDLPYGDRDSVGLFQQRPSQGWGPRAELMDPVYAAGAFYARLARVPGWAAMPVTEAAQAVQRSATPEAYGPWAGEASVLASALTGEAPAAVTCRLDGYAGAAPPPAELASAATREMGSQLIGVPLSGPQGWRVAAWAVAHAWNYHLRQVTYGSWVWTARSGRWVDYDPAGVSAAGSSAVTVAYGT